MEGSQPLRYKFSPLVSRVKMALISVTTAKLIRYTEMPLEPSKTFNKIVQIMGDKPPNTAAATCTPKDAPDMRTLVPKSSGKYAACGPYMLSLIHIYPEPCCTAHGRGPPRTGFFQYRAWAFPLRRAALCAAALHLHCVTRAVTTEDLRQQGFAPLAGSVSFPSPK